MLYTPYIRKCYFYFIYAIFNKKFFPKYTDSYMKEYKLYNKLLDKTSPEIESSAFRSSSKDRPTPIFILYIPILFIQNNSSSYFLLLSFSYKSLSLLLLPIPKKPIVEIDEVDDIDSDIKIQYLSP